jgi:hypothetical protein
MELSVLTIHTVSDFLYVPSMLTIPEPDGASTLEHTEVSSAPPQRFVRGLLRCHFRILTCDYLYFRPLYMI